MWLTVTVDKTVVTLTEKLGQPRFLRGDITPFLDHRFLDFPWVGPGPGAHLFGDIHALLSRLQLGHKLCDMFAGSLRLQGALLLWGILNYSERFIVANRSSFRETTASRSAQRCGLLGTTCDGGKLLHILLGYGTHLSGPLATLGVGGVAARLILALLLVHSFTLHNIILHIVFLLLGPTLTFILSAADLVALYVAVLHQRSSTYLHNLSEGCLLIFNEAILPVVFVTLLLLLGIVAGDIGCVASVII